MFSDLCLLARVSTIDAETPCTYAAVVGSRSRSDLTALDATTVLNSSISGVPSSLTHAEAYDILYSGHYRAFVSNVIHVP